ncbi:MAG: GNAT family N-acetyltransferase [Gemmatimonadaceae bacterium]
MVDDHSRLLLRAASELDLTGMARVHRSAYGAGHFLALLPEATLAEYYRLFLGGGTHAVVAESPAAYGETRALTGFAVFGANIEPRIREFKREQRLAILRTAMAHPSISMRKALFRLFGNGIGDSPHEPAPWLLLSIAVSGGRKGVGTALLRNMIQIATVERQQRLGLYVRHSNFAAVSVYIRAGFRIVASIADQYYMEVPLYPHDSAVTR